MTAICLRALCFWFFLLKASFRSDDISDNLESLIGKKFEERTCFRPCFSKTLTANVVGNDKGLFFFSVTGNFFCKECFSYKKHLSRQYVTVCLGYNRLVHVHCPPLAPKVNKNTFICIKTITNFYFFKTCRDSVPAGLVFTNFC